MRKTKYFKNGVPIYCGEFADFETMSVNEVLKIQERNFEQLRRIDKMAKSKGELLGRFVDIPVADGRAFYQIIRVNKNTVRVKVLDNLGDDYVFDYWGCESTVDKEYVVLAIKGRDKLDELFSK